MVEFAPGHQETPKPPLGGFDLDRIAGLMGNS